MVSSLTDQATSGQPTEALDQTAYQSAVISEVTRRVGRIRDLTQLANTDVGSVHQNLQTYDLDERSKAKVRASGATLLRELSAGRGLSWTDIARLVGVSSSAIRKWRAAEEPSGTNRLALARLAAFLDLLEEFSIEDPAGWMAVPIAEGFTLLPLDLYIGGRPDLLLEYVGQRRSTVDVLHLFDPAWREHYQSDYQVVHADDGAVSIRSKNL